MIVDLPPDLEARLVAEADRRGLAPDEWLRQLIDAASTTHILPDSPNATNHSRDADDQPAPGDNAKTRIGAILVEKWRKSGFIGSRPDIDDSLEHARAIRRKAERRERP